MSIFETPEWLFCLIPIGFLPIVMAFLRTRRAQRRAAFGNCAVAEKGGFLVALSRVCLVVGLALLVFAAARPRWGYGPDKRSFRARNLVIAIDVSQSMLAEDVRPNRLERVKADVADLIDSLKGDRCALIAFRRTGVTICPLTSDQSYLRQALEKLSPDSAPRGETNLGSAVREALTLLSSDAETPSEEDARSAIILISDGGDLREEVKTVAALAKKRGVPVFTVGIGDPSRAISVKDASGAILTYQDKVVDVRLDEKPLRELATLTDGRYVPLTPAGTADTTLGSIYTGLIPRVAIQEQNESETVLIERYSVFLYPALGFLLIPALLSRGRPPKRTSAKRI